MRCEMNSLAIAVADVQRHIKKEKTLNARIEKAMKAIQNHWLVTDKDDRFKAAVVAAILESPPDEAERIKVEMAAINKMSAALSATQQGVPVDFARMDVEVKDPIGLGAMWRKITEPPTENPSGR